MMSSFSARCRYLALSIYGVILLILLKGSRRLNYDLQVLCDHVRNNSIEKVVIYFQDSEGFQDALLADFIDVLTYDHITKLLRLHAKFNSSWIDRIPFVLLFNIATSIDIFEERLSHSTIKNLHGIRFELAQVDIDVLFEAATDLDRSQCLALGAGLSSIVLQRHRDYLQGSNGFMRTLKVMIMTGFLYMKG